MARIVSRLYDPDTPEVPQGGETQETGGGTVDLSSKVTLGDGTEVSVQELVEARSKVEGLEQYRDQARVLLTGDGEWTQERETATRALMADAGYSDAAIDAWVQQNSQAPTNEGGITGGPEEGGQQQEEPPVAEPEKKSNEEEKSPEVLALEGQVRALQDRIDKSEERGAEERADRLSRRLDQASSGMLDSHKDIGVLLGKATELNGADDDEKRRNEISGEIRERMVQGLRDRANRGGKFQDSWIQEEASRAADAVASRYRMVIGDLANLGRAPETVAGQDEFQLTEPVKPPELDRNASSAERRDAAMKYTTGTLLEMAAELSQGGDGKA